MSAKSMRLTRLREEAAVEREKDLHRKLHDTFWGKRCIFGRIKMKPPTFYTNATEQ
jgi:hypothetical protein